MWISNAKSNGISSLYTKSYLEAKLDFFFLQHYVLLCCRSFKSQTQYIEATLVFILKWKKLKFVTCKNLLLYQDCFGKQGSKIHFTAVAVCSLQSLGTLSTVNFSIMANKALVGQTTGTLCAFETIIMPGFIFVVDHTGSSSKSC